MATRLNFVTCAAKYEIMALWPTGVTPPDADVLAAIAGYLEEVELDPEDLGLSVPYALQILQVTL
jgi:hypothetical protein